MEGFNTAYAAARLMGVAMMLEDASSVEDVEMAVLHLETVHKEILSRAIAAQIIKA